MLRRAADARTQSATRIATRVASGLRSQDTTSPGRRSDRTHPAATQRPSTSAIRAPAAPAAAGAGSDRALPPPTGRASAARAAAARLTVGAVVAGTLRIGGHLQRQSLAPSQQSGIRGFGSLHEIAQPCFRRGIAGNELQQALRFFAHARRAILGETFEKRSVGL